ncbi:DUF418 domain-containing protein [Sphingomonas soli]|uniref:DUF418 domain-containing protein n=1 Tax=Sphingomonas soli TaxID=266127 RepID=UPI0008375966|nr:DUF418 domain-containing protein [Sphingomonas soli]
MTDMIARADEPDGAPRIAVLDILRGLAILGILFMNINDMGASFRAGSDIRHFGWTLVDQQVWWVREVFANGTARCLLEMLFGAGMVILTERGAQKAGKWTVMRRYYVRNLVLFAFGMAHMFLLLWGGDILHTYAIAALLVFFARNLRPRWLITMGLVMALLQLGGGGYMLYADGQKREQIAAVEAKVAAHQALTKDEQALLTKKAESQAKRAKAQAEHKAELAREDADRSSTTERWVAEQTRMSAERFFGLGEVFAIWEAASVMLIGAALFKLGILQGRRSWYFYLGLGVVAYAIGGTARFVGANEMMRFDDLPKTIWATQEVARIAMTLGHVALVNLLVKSAAGAWLMRPFVAAGRTALTIYVLQTLICLWVLYPPFALGLYGQSGWAAMMATAVGINLALLLLANWWINRFTIAPIEWLWRSIVDWRFLPWRAKGVAAA